MIVDDHTLDDEMLTFYKNAVDAMPDALLITSARKMPELLNGLKQDKPNVEQLRQRVTAKLQLKSPPPPVLDILRSATLSEPLIDVLSEKTIKIGLASLLDHFGCLSILAAMLLDARESVRELALAEMAKPSKARVATKTKEEELFKNRFKPLLETLRPILEGVPYEVPAPRTVALAPASIVTKEQQERDIFSSTLYRQLQKERNLLTTERDKLQSQVNKLSADLSGQTRLASERNVDLVAMQSQLNQRVAQGIADGLKNRLAPWLESCESLANWSSNSSSRLTSAQQLLARQAQQDKRYGTRAHVTEELAQARSLLAALQTAQQESLRPLPQLTDEIRALATHIAATEARLNQTSLQPQAPQLRALALTLNTLHDIDALQNHKKALERTMLAEAWGLPLCQQAFALIDRQVMAIYAEHHPDPKDIAPPVTPTQHLADCLLHARPCRLLIDGHNLLPKLKPLIGASYFKAGQGPTAQARALLIERVKTLTALHPLLVVDIWFDSPDDQHWSETDNLRVWFSGGKGSDRADGRILESLQSEVYRGTQTTRLVVTEDRDLLAQAQARGAIGVSPLEMWAMVG
ncbi:NYN domain-containing protein [Limnohabitans parvus]|uniref:Uncharacterized protein n=1 Tax=Limnohabitans parvus II-B4 TaxID=1293052 RepID=A0A315EEG6_9BURK|nr:hypothetical protein [Limnohabitans parvus]PUE55691.1 hypothetical protein B9Z37_03890 [Limnohabitans parvus II-B4]